MDISASDLLNYSRIMIIGNNGSGKSYLSIKLSQMTGLPVIHLDAEFWGPGWEKPSEESWVEKQKAFISCEKWIIDGNHTDTMALRFKAADAVVFLDTNRFTCIAGVLKRHGKKRPDMPGYLEERLDKDFFRFLKGLWQFSKKRKPVILDLHKKYPDKPFIVIKSRREMAVLLKQWEGSADFQAKTIE